jgi:hypothetical protein
MMKRVKPIDMHIPKATNPAARERRMLRGLVLRRKAEAMLK